MRQEYSQSINNVKSQSSLIAKSLGSNFHRMEFGQRLKKARERAELTQEGLAKISGVQQGTISKIERGDADSSTFTVQLAIACGVRPEWLALGVGNMIEEYFDPKIRAVATAMQNMPEYKKDVLVATSNTLAEQADQKNNNGTQ